MMSAIGFSCPSTVPCRKASCICVKFMNDAGQTEQARPPSGHPNHQGTVTCPKPDTLWGSPQGDVELMTQKKVLDFKSAWRLEQIGYERCKENDRKHRIG